MSLKPDKTLRASVRDATIEDILKEDDLYKILGASRDCGPAELRRCYLERSKTCHPDKSPYNAQSTSAFQRLGFAYEILKSSSSRRTYDQASNFSYSNTFAGRAASLDGERTFRNAVEAILHEFMTGDFVLVRRGLGALNRRYPNLMSDQVITNVEKSFVRIRELVLTTKTYALLVYIELRRIHRVQNQLMGLGYLDVVGRARLTVRLVRVTLAVPVRVDRALRLKEEREWRAKTAGYYAAGLTLPEAPRRAGFLNEKVSKVLEFLVGRAGQEEDGDDSFDAETNAACI